MSTPLEWLKPNTTAGLFVVTLAAAIAASAIIGLFWILVNRARTYTGLSARYSDLSLEDAMNHDFSGYQIKDIRGGETMQITLGLVLKRDLQFHSFNVMPAERRWYGKWRLAKPSRIAFTGMRVGQAGWKRRYFPMPNAVREQNGRFSCELQAEVNRIAKGEALWLQIDVSPGSREWQGVISFKGHLLNGRNVFTRSRLNVVPMTISGGYARPLSVVENASSSDKSHI